jgi:large subunit ribosomal protein L21
MFAVVRTGGKQYRVAPGDKIVVEKLDGNAGDKVTLGDVLLAGDGGNLQKTEGLTVAAEIVAQAKGEKVTVFKKRRRHNYRRKKGHRQQHTILKIVAIGDHKEQKKAAPKAEADKSAGARAKETAQATAEQHESGAVTGTPTANPAPKDAKAAGAEKPAAKKPAKAKGGSTENAAPAKAPAKKAPKAK